MILQKKNSKGNRQIEKSEKKPRKHDANLQINSSLYFQIGMIICLLVAYGLFETSFKTAQIVPKKMADLQEDDLYVFNVPIKILEATKQVEKKTKEPVVFNNPIIKDDEELIIETKNVVLQLSTKNLPVDPRKVLVEKKPEYVPLMNIMAVERVPIFPGCEDLKTNEARRQCMSDKIATHIQKKFKTDLASDLGLRGEQKIYVKFKIDKDGFVKEIKTNSEFSQLDKEAERVIGKLPRMTPGKQKNKNVEVVYGIPIKFNIIN